jgi:tRNA A37 threonylcarbamoyladenosine synthetase subunit TsaC/SUA5/YrdC
VAELGNPIISTSTTNRKGKLILDPAEIKNIFGSQVELMLSQGALNGKLSSIVDLSGETPEVVREGAGDVSLFFS